MVRRRGSALGGNVRSQLSVAFIALLGALVQVPAHAEAIPPPTSPVSWGSHGTAAGQFDDPNSIAIGPEGFVYVGDRANSRVQIFSKNGEFIRAVPITGTIAGTSDYPFTVDDIAVASDTSLYVIAHSGGIRRYAPTGELLQSISTFTSPGTFSSFALFVQVEASPN